jgi:hypothetical protein
VPGKSAEDGEQCDTIDEDASSSSAS